MRDNVKSIFNVLIIIVVCVVLGAIVLNVLLPNVTTQVINSTEDMIFRATGMSFDFNGDGESGGTSSTINPNSATPELQDGEVEGFK